MSRITFVTAVLLIESGCGIVDDAASPTPATFTYVRDEILMKSCAFSSCHGGGSGGLTLTVEDAYSQLVSVPSEAQPSIPRVSPGLSDSSYLIWKLEGREEIGDTDQMPPGSSLAPDKLEAIRTWIDSGAANN